MAELVDRGDPATTELIRNALSGEVAKSLLPVFRSENDQPELERQVLVALYEKLAREAIKEGETFQAYDYASRGIEAAQGSSFPILQLKQLQALALARGGAPHRANEILHELSEGGADDARTVGMLARTYRDFAMSATNPRERRANYRQAYKLALKGFEKNENYYNGIQAAQFCLFQGDVEAAGELAVRVEQLCRQSLAEGVGEDDKFWIATTLGESYLIRNKLDQAREALLELLELGQGRPADMGALLRVWRTLLKEVTGESEQFDELFLSLIQPVVVFSGHMIDGPGRNSPRFTESMVPAASRAISELVDQLNPRGGFCMGANGADLLFCEALLEAGHEVYLTLPFNVDETREVSVRPAGDDWVKRWDRIVNEAHTVKELRLSMKTATGADYAYANSVMSGMAKLRAYSLESRVVPVVLWDGVESGEPGGTWDFVKFWRNSGEEPQTILTSSFE